MGRGLGWLGAIVVALGLMISPAMTSAAKPCHVRAHYSYSVRSFSGVHVSRLTVHFPHVCRSPVRAFVEHRGAGGPVVEVGATVRRPRSQSTVISRNAGYCRIGWQSWRLHHWRPVTLHSHGHC